MADEPDRERALRALEMSTLTELRKGEAVVGWTTASRIEVETECWAVQICGNSSVRGMSMLRLPARPEDYIADLVAAADAGIERVAQAVTRGDVAVSNGELHLPALTAEVLPAGVAEARRALAAARIRPVAGPAAGHGFAGSF